MQIKLSTFLRPSVVTAVVLCMGATQVNACDANCTCTDLHTWSADADGNFVSVNLPRNDASSMDLEKFHEFSPNYFAASTATVQPETLSQEWNADPNSGQDSSTISAESSQSVAGIGMPPEGDNVNTATLVPEPSSAAFGLLGLIFFLFRRARLSK